MIKSVITKSELVRKLKANLESETGIHANLKHTEEVYETFIETFVKLIENLKTDEKLVLPGLGSFYKKTIKARQGINPKTKEIIQIPETTRITFKKSK